jgi:hypothetical protein
MHATRSRAALAAATGTAAALLLAEAFLAATSLDMRLLAPLLYYQTADVAVCRPSRNIALHYENAPGARLKRAGPGPVSISINALGFRGIERVERKPKGVVRVVCFGGSNTFGALVDDDQTYPAYLERELNRGSPRRYEVWNAGVHAYTLAQDVAAAREVVARYDPDVLIFQIGNPGRRPFLKGEFRRYFEVDPALYHENLVWPASPGSAHDFLMSRWRLYRAVVVSVNRLLPGWLRLGPQPDALNHAALRQFARADAGRAAVMVLSYPGYKPDLGLLPPSAPVLDLGSRLPPGASHEYRNIHPPARVYAWYARELASFLEDRILRRDRSKS